MGRRFTSLLAMALAFGGWIQPARSQSDASLSPPAEAAGSSKIEEPAPFPAVEDAPATPPPVTKKPATSGAKSPGFKLPSGLLKGKKPTNPPAPTPASEAPSDEAIGKAAAKSAPLRVNAQHPGAASGNDEEPLSLPNEADLGKAPAQQPPVDALPPPGEVEPPAAKKDESVVQTQSPPPQQPAAPTLPAAGGPDGHDPLPAAKGSTPNAPKAGAAASDAESFVLPADRLQKGEQSVSLSVRVIGPETLNLQQEAKLKIVVKNSGTADALGVVVRDDFPAALELVSSQPAQEPSSGSRLVWKLGTVPAGSESLITMNVRAIQVGEVNHAATVSMLAGAKSRTIVRQPKLKVDQQATTGKVIKGRPVEFKITVSNTGDGPARNVVIRAKLSQGLKVNSQDASDTNLFELALEEDLAPGRTIELEPIVADTVLGGEQSCQVYADSPDVQPNLEGAKSIKTLTVVEPKLKLELSGDEKRFTDTIAAYNVNLVNPGTTAARNAQVVVTLSNNGRPQLPIPANGKWDASQRRISWSINQLEPGPNEKLSLPFQVLMGGTGTFQVTAEAKAGMLYDKASLTTTIDGVPLVELEVKQSANRRIVDVNVPIIYTVKIRNTGTKEATNILVKAQMSDNLEVDATRGTEHLQSADGSPVTAGSDEKKRTAIFPVFPRLEPNKELTLGILVHGVKAGQGFCRVYLTHDNDEESRLEDAEYTRITPGHGQ